MLLILNNTHGFSAFTVFKAKNAHENCIHRYSEIRVELANCSPNTLQNFKLMYIMYILSNACNCTYKFYCGLGNGTYVDPCLICDLNA